VDKIAWELGYLQGWMGSPYEYGLKDQSHRLQSLWHTAYNQGRVRYLEEPKIPVVIRPTTIRLLEAGNRISNANKKQNS